MEEGGGAVTLRDLPPVSAFRLSSAFDPRPVTAAERATFRLLITAYLFVVGVLMYLAGRPLAPNLALPPTHAWVSAVLSLVISMMLYGLASESGRRSPWMLAMTYQVVGMILLAFPFFFPGVFRADRPLVGSMQSAPALFYSWQLILVGGLAASLWALWADQRRLVRPERRGFTLPVVSGCLVVAGLLAFAALAEPLLPALVAESGLTPAAIVLDWFLAIAAVAAAVAAVLVARTHGTYSHWLATIMVIVAGQCLVSINSERWDLGWYFNRGFNVLADTVLVLLLLTMMGRVTGKTMRLAATDSLTGVGNRVSIAAALADELALARLNGRTLALIRVDIDGFKEINDQLGTDVGDEVLGMVADRIQRLLRPADRIGRTSGDEFAVVLCDGQDPAARAEPVAQAAVAVCREPINIADAHILLTVSVGTACFPADATAHPELYAAAGLAFGAAKEAGGDRWLAYAPEFSRRSRDRARLRSDLAAALREGAFGLDYQPIVRSGTGEPLAVEALVRWLRDGRRVSAGAFIGLAEQSGQIVVLGRLVLRALAADLPTLCTVLPADGFVSVNLSAAELADDEILAALLAGPLREHSECMVLEVTESLDLHPVTDLESRLGRLREAGYRLAIDDFGSGFSNFARLGLLEPHLLKIDRSLVVRAGSGEPSGKLMLEAAAGVALGLGCEVIAEGVETADEHQAIADLAIAYEQGYRYCRPVPLQEAMRWLVVRPPRDPEDASARPEVHPNGHHPSSLPEEQAVRPLS